MADQNIIVKWQLSKKRWGKERRKFETHVKNQEELEKIIDFIKTDSKMKLISVEY